MANGRANYLAGRAVDCQGLADAHNRRLWRVRCLEGAEDMAKAAQGHFRSLMLPSG